MLVISFMGLYLLSSGSSLLIFSYLMAGPAVSGPSSSELESTRSKIGADLPRTQVCPINGAKFTDIEKDIWEKRRPMAVVIENHSDSRPQSGLTRADVVYEVVAEGGITRFLSIFYCGASAEDLTIGPIRSARVYLINWAQEYGEFPMFVHFGGANNICQQCPGGVKPYGTVAKEVLALEKLITMGWRHRDGNALDGGANVSYPVIWRDQERLGVTSAWEHSAFGSSDKLFQEGIKRGFGYKDSEGNLWSQNFTSWDFVDEKALESPLATDISFEFWSNKEDYNVNWKYDKNTNRYLRFNGGKEHLDFNNKDQISAKNIVIMFIKEKGPVDKEHHMFYQTTGEGKILIFQNGDVIEGTWTKAKEDSRTKFLDKKGKPINFVRGQIWIEALPQGNEVSY